MTAATLIYISLITSIFVVCLCKIRMCVWIQLNFLRRLINGIFFRLSKAMDDQTIEEQQNRLLLNKNVERKLKQTLKRMTKRLSQTKVEKKQINYQNKCRMKRKRSLQSEEEKIKLKSEDKYRKKLMRTLQSEEEKNYSKSGDKERKKRLDRLNR